jgi:hypothetical protein
VVCCNAYIYIVVELYSPRAVEFHLFQGLSHHVVGLVLRLLGALDDGALVEVALVVDVELAEGILQAKDLALLELGVFPVRNGLLATVEASGCREKGGAPTYFCSLMMFMLAVRVDRSLAQRGGYTGRQRDCLAPPRSGCAFVDFEPLFCLPDDDVGRLPRRTPRGAGRNLIPDYVRTSPRSLH